MKPAILIVDDERDMRQLLKRSLAPEMGCRVEGARSGEDALALMSGDTFDLVLADIKMPGMGGLELIERIKRANPDQTVVMMTAHGSIDAAVQAMKSGAYDFITKPFDHEALVLRLEKALERSSLLQENTRLLKACRQADVFQDLAGSSSAMKQVFETIRTVAQTDLTVLITGESGTGKDLTARAVHTLSRRHNGPFVAVNCPTVPESILESELFGYKKGAFTHAFQNKIGLFQEAQKGSIFLDEIGEVSPTIQAKLLRVLQEKEIKPLGDTKTVAVDVRIIASTNRDLQEKIRQGEFREDFFYRINVLPIRLPPLRERTGDIPLIASHLLKKHCAALDKPLKKLSPELLNAFMGRQWVGNVRELENLIVQGIIFSGDTTITPRDVGLEDARPGTDRADRTLHRLPYKAAKEETLRRFNERFIGDLLTASGGNVTQAARACGLERQALQQIMRRYRIKADAYREKR